MKRLLVGLVGLLLAFNAQAAQVLLPELVSGLNARTTINNNFAELYGRAVLDWSVFANGYTFTAGRFIIHDNKIWRCSTEHAKAADNAPGVGAGWVETDDSPPSSAFTNLQAFINAFGWDPTSDAPETDPYFSAWNKSYNDLINKPTIPTTLAELVGDATHRTVTDAEKALWSNTGLPPGVPGDTILYGESELVAVPTVPLTVTAPLHFAGDQNPAVISIDLSAYQPILVSGANLKTINGTSLLGNGNLVITGGSGGGSIVTLAGIPYSDVACTDSGKYESFLYLCIDGFYTAKIATELHDNVSPPPVTEDPTLFDFEEAGTPAGWTLTSNVDPDATVSPLVDEQSLVIPVDGALQTAKYDFIPVATISQDFYFLTTNVSTVSTNLVKVFDSATETETVFTIYLSSNGLIIKNGTAATTTCGLVPISASIKYHVWYDLNATTKTLTLYVKDTTSGDTKPGAATCTTTGNSTSSLVGRTSLTGRSYSTAGTYNMFDNFDGDSND